jgi:hypothetical protein
MALSPNGTILYECSHLAIFKTTARHLTRSSAAAVIYNEHLAW